MECRPVTKNGTVKAYVYGISYPQRDVRENLAQKFHRGNSEGFSIGLLHANVGHQDDHANYAPCSIDDLVSGNMDYWALGHIHRFQVLRESNPAVVYSGNTQARHIKETGGKGCCLVTLHKGVSPEIQFVPTDVVRYAQGALDLTGTISLDEVITGVRGECERFAGQVKDRDVFINLQLNGRTRIHAELIKGGTLEALQEEVRSYFEGRVPAIWLDLKLDTYGIYDMESLRQGKDFIADLIVLFDDEEKSEAHAELKEVLKPLFETWQGIKYLDDLSDTEMKNLLVQARSLVLDRLLGAKD